ncbi:MAG: helix-turn-helix transcriptional regulator [Coxiellaceae bacterium]|nr:helix-turn-helix transcriptional regulator [Coxiellaceae bacterium]
MIKPKKLSSQIVPAEKIRYRTYYHEIHPGAYLTVKEKECLRYMDPISTYADVAEKMGLSRRTVEAHIQKIREKFHCKRRYELFRLRELVFYEGKSTSPNAEN